LTDPNHYVIRAPVRDYAPKTTLINVFEGWILALLYDTEIKFVK